MGRERFLVADRPTAARRNWWTERGWDEAVDDEESPAEVITFVRDGQC
jgi:hypothetical protein